MSKRQSKRVQEFFDNAMRAADMLCPYEELALSQLEKLNRTEIQQLLQKMAETHTTDASQFGAMAIIKHLAASELTAIPRPATRGQKGEPR